MDSMASSFKLLGDATRLRLLRLVAREELTAGELTQIVEAGQSTVSRHVAMLREAGLLKERWEGRFAFYSLTPEATRRDGPWAGLVARLSGAPDSHGDLARLADVLRARREDDDAAPEGSSKAPYVPGRSWTAWAQALCWLVPPGMRVLDLGCGDGALTLEIARFASEVVGVDRNPALIARATALAERRGVKNVKFVRGDAEALDFRDESFDLAVLSQTLHSLENPAKSLAETARVLAPGARVLVLDLLPHEHEWVREKLGHRCLGFSTEELATLISGAGFAGVEVERVAGKPREPFQVALAIGLRKVGRTSRRRISR
jgi:ArsR family transcriptional regulator